VNGPVLATILDDDALCMQQKGTTVRRAGGRCVSITIANRPHLHTFAYVSPSAEGADDRESGTNEHRFSSLSAHKPNGVVRTSRDPS
jgi:hypothetical protein